METNGEGASELVSDEELCARCRFVGHLYRELSDISRTKSQNLNDSRLVLHLSLPNLLKPGVNYRTRM